MDVAAQDPSVSRRPRVGEGTPRLPVLPLTCLAPDIVEAILDGRQHRGLRLAEMLGNRPLGWEEQRRVFGLRYSA
jgi:hypothetical protein